MRWSAFSLFGLLSLFAALPQANATGEDYAVLIISRERLEVPTSCEIGVYLNDELAARLLQEQTTSFNLPHGTISIRLKQLPGQMPGARQACSRRPRSRSRSRPAMCSSTGSRPTPKACTCDLPPSNIESTKRSQPSAAPALECNPPVGSAEGCDLLLFRLALDLARMARLILVDIFYRE